MTGGIGVACVYDPRSGQKWHIDANGVIEGKPAEAGRGVNWAGHPGSSGLWRRDQVCQWRRDVDARGCGRIMRSGDVGGIRAECIGEWRRRGGRHVVLVLSHCGCSSAECSKGGQVQLGRQGPVL